MIAIFKHIIEILNNPYLVSRIQEFLGIKLVKIENEEKSIKNDITGSFTNTKNKYGYKEMAMLDNRTCIYQQNCQFLYYFFMIITSMGNEIFYIFFLPLLMWNFDVKITYLTTMSWALSMYIGQASKDLIKMPRPATPPVIRMLFKLFVTHSIESNL